MKHRTCTWIEWTDFYTSSVYNTQCGQDYCFEEVPIEDCDINFCQYCGGKMVQKKPPVEES